MRELRLANGMTQEMLAAKLGKDRSYIGFLERGEGNPSLTTLISLAKVLGTQADFLIKK